jgi:F0F1-type ATP synthase assembly protein I
MFRPLILIGAFLVGIALFSFLLIPGFRSSPRGMVILVLCLGIGIFAIVKDLRDFWREIKAQQQPKEDPGSGGDNTPEV